MEKNNLSIFVTHLAGRTQSVGGETVRHPDEWNTVNLDDLIRHFDP